MVIGSVSGTLAQDSEDRFSIHGQLKNETAYRFVDPTAFTKILNIARLEARYFPTSSFSVTAVLRTYYDAAYDVQKIDRIVPRKSSRTILSQNLTAEQIAALRIDNLREVEIRQKETELKEIYADWSFRRLDLRFGKQIVRWGVVEGARVTDEINPLDFQEFILREIQDRYIPLWMLKADMYYFDPYAIEILWIPELKGHQPASKGSEWEQFQLLENLKEPSQNLPNSEWAIKVSKPVGSWNVSGSYFYTWDDFPSSFRTVFGLGEFGVSPEVAFRPRYERLHIFGGTFTGPLGQVVLSGEAAYVAGKYFGTLFGRFNPVTGVVDGGNTLQLNLGELQRDYAKYALSADFRLFKTDFSLQIQQQYIFAYQPEIIQDRFDTILGAFARQEGLYGRLTAELLLIYFINDKEIMIRPKGTYQLTDAFKIAVGADIFEGTIGGPLPGEFHFAGFFKNNDRVYLELIYSF